MALQNHFSTCSADWVSCLLLVLTSCCCSIFEIQSRFLRRPCQCHCSVVLVLNKTHISATFGSCGCKYSKDFKWKTPGAIRGMFGVQMAPLEVPRVPSPPPCFSPLCTFLCCALFSTVHFSPLCTGQTALLWRTALHQKFSIARRYILVFCTSAHHYSSLDCMFAEDQFALH